MSKENIRKNALVTGGSRGIGLGICQSLLAEGWNVMICGTREASQLKETLASLSNQEGRVHYCQADIGSADARVKLVNEVYKTFPVLHLLVNNAGIAPKVRQDLLEATEESFTQIMDINLKGPYFLTQKIAAQMIKDRPDNETSIINISSISSHVASVNRGDYCMSKAALSMSTKLWAARLGEYGIPVYEIQPGLIQTDMTSKVKEKYDSMIADGLLVEPRWGRPEDIGRAVAMLAKGDLPYATGQVLKMDGGLTLERL